MWNRSKKATVLSIIGLILLGALGSGLWDVFFRPVAIWIGLKLLTLATFGLESIRDSSYQSIAKGHHERPAFLLLGTMTTFLIMTPLVLGPLILLSGFLRNRITKPPPRLLVYVLILSSIFVGSIGFVLQLRMNYENTAITHFEQSIAIVAPYVETDEEKLFLSRFAQIRNKDDYVEIIRDLEQVAEKNNLTFPDFSVW